MAVGISRELLHELLWERRYGDDLVDINQAELAQQLFVTRPTMNRVIRDMVEAGWLKPEGDQVYRIYDPESAVATGD